MPEAAVALICPKFPRNVGNALRACSNFGARYLGWTPERVEAPHLWPAGERLPREERMKLYEHVQIVNHHRSLLVGRFEAMGFTPVAVEVRAAAEPLPEFRHPDRALYVFGPEDGTLDRGVLSACHRFVVIPTSNCLNLSAAVNVVLYDRAAKDSRRSRRMPRQTAAYGRAEG
jgi:tRNA(Leu) C34 or U34 (ribose-2'-O)-methylase TrmL